MAADHNMNFGVFPQSFCNQRVVSFQSGAVNSSAGVIPGSTSSSSEVNGIPGLVLPGNAAMMNNPALMIQQCNSPSNGFIEPVHGVKQGSTLAVHWSYQELAVLRDGLDKFANEPNIMKYIKIAARLPEKTVRDVAMRCQWMMKENGKRRKHEEYYAGKKLKDGKEITTDSSLWINNHQLQQRNKGSYSVMMPNVNHNNQFAHEAPVIDSATWHLLEENSQLINQISANLETFQVLNNIDLFNRVRNNITATLDGSMSQMPGIMSRMPPLPVTMNEKLVDSLMISTPMAHAPGSSHPKDEPRCW
ncbi:uncharacterized protein [Typha angustifolia]|uniref:uncharacterized protein isoform X3 n=1 Tax=Typha angustifolia TaxID=59011 RepID=UPI003C2DA2B6